MFHARHVWFNERLGWDMPTFEEEGVTLEKDQYDCREKKPLYIIYSEGGKHLASGRILHTKNGCIVDDHFNYLNDGKKFGGDSVFEATRFVTDPSLKDKNRVLELALTIFVSGFRYGQISGVERAVALLDDNTYSTYNKIGNESTVIGEAENIKLVYWDIEDTHIDRLDGIRMAMRSRAASSQARGS